MANLPDFEVYNDSVSDGIRFEHGIARKSKFRSVIDEFSSFTQRSDTNVRAWQKCSGGTKDDYFGETFRIPLSADSAVVKNSIATINKDGTSKVISKSDINSPCYYISITYKDIDKSAYDKFIDSKYMTLSDGYNSRVIMSTGTMVSIIPHTLYDSNLYGCEQGLSACSKISDLQLHKFSKFYSMYDTVEPNLLNYSRPTGPNSASHEKCYTTPLPGTGCPMLVYGEQEKSVYDNIEFFFTKTNTNAVISLCFCNSDDESIEPVWQTLSFGMMDVNNTSYKFPLYISGGTLGLRLSSYTYIDYPRHTCTIVGNIYDFNMRGITLNNTCPLYPSKLETATLSNFMILNPAGEWVYTYNYEQIPQVLVGNTDDNVYVCDIEYAVNKNNSYISCDNSLSNALCIYNSNNKIANKIHVFAESDETGIVGDLPNMYYSSISDKNLYIYMNNTMYLSVPNGWDERLPYYKSISDYRYLDTNYLSGLHKFTLNNRLLIKVGVKS